MKLTPHGEKLLTSVKSRYLDGKCTGKQYLERVKRIYQDDVARQVAFLMDQGFNHKGALKNIYNLDGGSEEL